MTGKSKLWALLKGDHVAAGDLYYREGHLQKASELYARAGNYAEAAKVALEAGLPEVAVDLYLKGDSPLKAGELLAVRGQHKEAIPYFEKASAFWQAAESALTLQQYHRAARLFERAEALDRSAECYEMSGELQESLRMWEAESKALRERDAKEPEARKKRRQVDLHRSKGLIKLGRRSEAARILLEWGMPLKAAQLFEMGGDFGEAARSYLEANEAEKALELLPRAPDLDDEIRVRIYARCGRHAEAAHLYQKLGAAADAAEAFEAAEDWVEAGRSWEEADEPVRAAELFYRADLLTDAARCYAKAKNFRLAGETYAKVGDHEAAAECLLEVEESLLAAKHYIKAGDKGAASDALQSIRPDAEDFEEATLILVPLLVQDQLYEGALHRLKLLPNASTVGAMAVERLYWEGRILDALGNLAEAEVVYQKAISLRREHRDLTRRLSELRERKEKQQKIATAERLAMQDGAVNLETGQVLVDRYEIVEELGRGGMSRVYKAKDRDLGELVAIKTLMSRPGDQLRSEERLLREVQICRRITHPNVVRVYDIGRVPGGIFVTMELLEGMTLDRLIDSKERLPLDRLKQLMRDILNGLHAAHVLKVVHRDLKPANIALTRQYAKIMDFGIAHVEDTDVNLTQTGQVIGSPMYMSPEQIQGQNLDARTDLYSFGVLCFTLLTGREPFVGKTATAISLMHLQEAPPDLLDQREDLDPAWGSFVTRLLAKSPSDRYQSAEEVLGDVAELPG